MNENRNITMRLPGWLRTKMPGTERYFEVKQTVEEKGLNTICRSGLCPNIGECWAKGTATFMILGDVCTRFCRFCGVTHGQPVAPDPQEPEHIADAVRQMKLQHAVITSVTRDDLKDGGATHWAQTLERIKFVNPDTTVEALIPDFNGDFDLIQKIIDQGPAVISHNLETVERLTPLIRSRAKYRISLRIVEFVAKSQVLSKSGIMLGLGETDQEVFRTIDDLRNAGCRIISIGQYLQPKKTNYQVINFIEPEKFEVYRQYALKSGFSYAECGPLVRSSYNAAQHVCHESSPG